ANVPSCFALKAPREIDPRAVHGVDLAVVREARPFAGEHEVLPWTVADPPGREAAAAVLAQQRKTEQKPNRQKIYRLGLSSHTLFSSQAINESRSATTS